MIKSKRARTYVGSLLFAVEVIVAFSILGNLSIGEISLSLANIPVLVAAMLLGPAESTILGLVYGLTSMWNASSQNSGGLDVLLSPFNSGAPVNSIILAVGTRVVFGLVAGLIYLFIKKSVKEEDRHVSIFSSLSLLFYNLLFSGVLHALFGTSLLFEGNISTILFSFFIDLIVGIVVLSLVKMWVDSENSRGLFDALEENNSFKMLNYRMKFYVTIVISVVVVVACTLLFLEFHNRLRPYLDRSSEMYKYYLSTFIQCYLSIVLAIFILAMVVRYFAFYALFESERTMTMINMIPGGVACFDVEGDKVTIHFASQGVKDLIGKNKEDELEAEGKNPFNYVHPEDIAQMNEAIENFTKNDNIEIVYRLYNVKKGYIWVSLRAYMTQRIGNKIRVYGVILDIDDQVRRNMELEQRFIEGQMVNDVVAGDALFSIRVNLTTNECSLENSAEGLEEDIAWIESITNVDEFFKKASERNTNMDSMLSYQKLFNRESLLKNFEHGKTSVKFEHNFLVSDTKSKWIETRLVLMCNPSNNDIEGYIYARDIDEQKKSRLISQRILSGEYEYVELIDIEDDSIAMYVSRPTEDIGFDVRKLTYTHLIEGHLYRIVLDDQKKEFKQKMAIASIINELESRHVYSCAFSVNTDLGVKRKMFAFQYLDKFRRKIIFTQSDITDMYVEDQRKSSILHNAIKVAEEANAARTDFFARIGHDLRTPINSIVGLSNIALKEEDPEKLKDYLSKICMSGEFILSLTDDILDMADMDKTDVDNNITTGTISQSLDEVFKVLEPQILLKKIDFIYTPGSFVDDPVLFSKQNFKQIMMNLLSNAIKFTPEEGKVWLTIDQHLTRNSTVESRFIIKDTGVGMSKEFMEKVFEPFAQEEHEDINNDFGTGLGLSIVKKLVSYMDGSISFTSEPNVGTEFVVELSFKESFQELDTSNAENLKAYERLQGKHILLVEDNLINNEIATVLLGNAGMKVTSVDNGLKAVLMMEDIQNKNKFDAILMDIQMPVLDGLKATKKIRSLDSEYAKQVPIIAMTANNFDSDVKKSIEAGMNDHISKPFAPQDLFEALDREIFKGK